MVGVVNRDKALLDEWPGVPQSRLAGEQSVIGLHVLLLCRNSMLKR